MAITPTFTLVNTAGIEQGVIDQFEAMTAAALSNWSAVLAGDAAVTVRIEFSTEVPGHTMQARWGNGLIVQQDADVGYVIGGAAADLQGAEGRTQNDADIWILVDPAYIANTLFLDATPETRNDIPADRLDGLSVMMQELGHALGFSGYYNETANTFDYNLKTAYDARLTVTDGKVFFDGPNVRALLGGAVPLTPGFYSAYGTTDGDPVVNSDPLLGLMNGVAYHSGFGYTIGDLDLAMMADMGIGTTRDDILNISWVPTMHGGAGNDTVTGGGGANLLTGDDGNDTIAGGGGRDRLEGGAGNDVLNGGSGTDLMLGGAGNDRYYIDVSADRVFETGTTSPNDATDAGGIDTVISPIAFSLAAQGGMRFVENLTLTGTANIRGIGNDLANRIIGNAGNNALSGGSGADTLRGEGGADKLSGGEGRDTLSGGAGVDTFQFDTTAASANRDRITDFSHAEGDTIRFAQSAFAGFGHVGKLSADAFYAAADANKAHDASDRIIYNTATGMLYYDADGLGGAAAVQIAQVGLTAHPALLASDILIIA